VQYTLLRPIGWLSVWCCAIP